MWPFNRKEPEIDATAEAISELRAFRDLGETFTHLGRTCVVTGHCEYMPFGIVPLLRFDYCDDNGRIRSASLRLAQLPAVIKQQKPAKRHVLTRDDEMAELLPCPCGETPTYIGVMDAGQGYKYALAVPNCCQEWMIEFRTAAHDLKSDETRALAIVAWNSAPRVNK